MSIHINAPEPIETRDMTEADYRKHSILWSYCSKCEELKPYSDLEVSFYEWYSPIVRCKQGKGCRRGDNQ